MYILYTHFLYYICCKIDYYSKDKKGTISQVTNNLLMTYVTLAPPMTSRAFFLVLHFLLSCSFYCFFMTQTQHSRAKIRLNSRALTNRQNTTNVALPLIATHIILCIFWREYNAKTDNIRSSIRKLCSHIYEPHSPRQCYQPLFC